MPVFDGCDSCGRLTPVYRLAGVILDGRVGRVCPRCMATQKGRLATPYAPRTDQGAIQPSTPRDTW